MSEYNDDEINALKEVWEKEQYVIAERISHVDGFTVAEEDLAAALSATPPKGVPYLLDPAFFESEEWRAMVCAPVILSEPPAPPPCLLATDDSAAKEAPCGSRSPDSADCHDAALKSSATTREASQQSLPRLRYIAATDISFMKQRDLARACLTPTHNSNANNDSNTADTNTAAAVDGDIVDGDGDDANDANAPISRIAIASLAVLSFPDLTAVYQDYAIVDLCMPYVPGFLTFREVPALLPLLDRLRARRPELWPQLLLVDGNGALHPRGAGIAAHLGVLTGIPTVGVAKELYAVDGLCREGFKTAVRACFVPGVPQIGQYAFRNSAKHGDRNCDKHGGDSSAKAEADGVVAAAESAVAVVARPAPPPDKVSAAWRLVLPAESLLTVTAKPAVDDTDAESSSARSALAPAAAVKSPCRFFPLVGSSGRCFGAATLLGPSAATAVAAKAKSCARAINKQKRAAAAKLLRKQQRERHQRRQSTEAKRSAHASADDSVSDTSSDDGSNNDDTANKAACCGHEDDRDSSAATALRADASGSVAEATPVADVAALAAAAAEASVRRAALVSVGHRVSLATAVAIVVAVAPWRIPEPLRAADLGSREVVRRWLAARAALVKEAACADAASVKSGKTRKDKQK